MATKYSDIIRLRESKPAYNILNEEKGEWSVFIANDQFNDILRKIITAVRNDDADAHKSFWVEGTYGTGKSHAGAVIKHLLCDPVDDIREYIDEEYKAAKYAVLKNNLYKLREKKRLFPVALYGSKSIAHKDDLSLQLQKEIKEALEKAGIDIIVKTDFDNYVSHIEQDPIFWDMLIGKSTSLQSIAPDRKKLIQNLKESDTATLSKVKDALREGRYDIRLESANLSTWFFEVQDALRANTDYNGLLVIWDEFTDVMTSDIGPSILVTLQELTEQAMNSANDSYFFFISHPSALNSLKAEERDKTKGRYHYMKYNMEPVSAFKIMSRKFKRVAPDEEIEKISMPFFSKCNTLLDSYASSSTSPEETLKDIKNLFPLHPATANLATYYAREAGSSSRSVFEFLGSNPAIKEFLDSPEKYLTKDTITADYLWDYVLDVFNENVSKFGAVTERYNSYKERVEHLGSDYYAVFKSILLLNALNNIANNTTVTPSEDNIKNLFIGTPITFSIEDILNYFNDNGVIQRAPGGVFSIQFSALPTKEIEERKQTLVSTDFKTTAQVINFDISIKDEFEKYLANIARPCSFGFFSIESNEHTLLNKVENGRRSARDYELYLAVFVARNSDELNTLRDIAKKASVESRFSATTFIVFMNVFTDKNYDRFIEYQANAYCAQQHGFADQQQSNVKSAREMVKEWLKDMRRGQFETYIDDETLTYAALKLTSVININIAPRIFSAGPESLDIIKEKYSKTYWKKSEVKETVKSVLLYNTKEDICDHCKGPAVHIQYILQDSVDDNLQFKAGVNPNHPLVKVCQFVEKKIKYADKQNTFNLAEKFEELTRPPYGLYKSYAGMGMLAFALRPWVNKFFDNNGKPRTAQHLVEDVVEIFRCWEDKKSPVKLSFRFETPEEGKLCKAFINIFNLTKYRSEEDISSLKNARWEVTHSYIPAKKYPLWSLKYYPGDVKEEVRVLVDKINAICTEVGSSNPNMMTEVVEGINKYNFELKNLVNTEGAFEAGFRAFLKSDKSVSLQDDEFEQSYIYIYSKLQSEIGMWNEEEVMVELMRWKLSIPSTPSAPQSIPSTTPGMYPPHAPVAPNPAAAQIYSHKKVMAGDKIDSLQDIEQAKRILRNIASLNYSDVLDKIIEG